MDENSCSTPSILTAVMAAPSIELSKARRKELPTVVPQPRSKGCAENFPYLSVRDSSSAASRLGFLKPFHIVSLPSPRQAAAENRFSGAPRGRGAYFEYSSTISCSVIGGVVTSSRLGRAATRALKCSRSISSHGTVFWLCATLRASSTMAFWCMLSFSPISSPALTRYDGMLTFFPLPRTFPCSTAWRACAREAPHPPRHTALPT